MISGFKWNPARGEGIYTIEGPGAKTYSLSVRTEGKTKVVLMLWQGDRHDEKNYLVADSDPMRLVYEDERETFYEAVVEVFHDREMAWFREVLAFVARNHGQRVNEEKEEQFQGQVKGLADYRQILGTDYLATPNGFAEEVKVAGGRELVSLSNFTARIVEDVLEDDGSGEINRFYVIEARLGDRIRNFEVAAAWFGSLAWVPEKLGALAVIEPPASRNKSRVARAIQGDSTDLHEVRAFAHTGWVQADGRWVYLHGGGALTGLDSAAAPFEGRVALRGKLARRVLSDPASDERLREAVRASFRLWDLAADEVMIPVDLAAKRAALGECDFSVHLAGKTGLGKTSLALVALNYFGTGLKEQDLLSFESTANSIEAEAFQLKDQLCVLDDFLGTPDHQRVMARIARAAANNSGRSRMAADGTLKGDRPPRALMLSTGEDVPTGESLTARTLVLRIPENDGVDLSEDGLINACQDDARNGVYARAMSGFISWLAPRYGRLDLESERARLGHKVRHRVAHTRTPMIFGDLYLALQYWLEFALDVGAIDGEGYAFYLARGEAAIRAAIGAQAEHQQSNEPIERFAELLAQAVANGKAYLAAEPLAGDVPRERQGVRVGWTKEDGIFLYPETALTAAKNVAQRSGRPLEVSAQLLGMRLHDRGLLVSTDKDAARGRLTVRRVVGGDRGTFWHLPKSFLFVGENVYLDDTL